MGKMVPTTSLEVTERMGAEAAAVGGGPRITLDHIKDEIAYVFYVGGEDAAQAGHGEAFGRLSFEEGYKGLRTMTICIIQFKNGFNVIGQATPASARNFDPNVGKINAYENAIRQAWPLFAFSLLDQLGEIKHG